MYHKTETQKFRCDLCEISFGNLKLLKEHYIDTHEEKDTRTNNYNPVDPEKDYELKLDHKEWIEFTPMTIKKSILCKFLKNLKLKAFDW